VTPLDRYAPLVDDEAAFRAACRRPLPRVVRTNPIRSDPERVAAALRAEGVGFERLGWAEGLFRVDTDSPGTTWPYVHGWIHGQEAVSCLPALALAPEPGEVVWDACAAPGNKTTQIAGAMDDVGTVIANDTSLGRLSALRHNAERLGATAVAVTVDDARTFSLNPFPFDAVDRTLVDAPCSCEGTCRKNPDALAEWSLDHVRSLAPVQTDILRRAVQATRPGGVVVYATCTFAPEENEAVLDAVLDEEPCRIERWDPPLETSPGITEWAGETFDPAVERARRIYPHQNDTGGFFCAKLRVGGDAADESGSAEVDGDRTEGAAS